MSIARLMQKAAGNVSSAKYLAVGFINQTACIELYDVSNPSNPVYLDTYTHPTSITPFLTMSPSGNYLIAREGKNVHILDISAGNLTFVTTYTTSASALNYAQFLPDDSGLLLGVVNPGNELEVCSFDGTSVSFIASYNTPNGSLNPGVYHITITDDGQYAILICGRIPFYMAIYSIAYSPITLTHLSTTTLSSLSATTDVTSDGNYLAMSLYDSSSPYDSTIIIYDISTKSSPVQIGSDTYNGGTDSTNLGISYSYFSSDDQTLFAKFLRKVAVIDVSTKSAPSIGTPGFYYCDAMTVLNPKPYVIISGDVFSGAGADFLIYDASTPTSLVLESSTTTSNRIYQLATNQ